MPKVSVIIPCYNQGSFLDEAVDSVLAQSFSDFEIVVVNDGSTDPETQRILSAYRRPQTRVIHTANQGLAAARNNGIREACGEYILPLDADDRIGPDYMEEALAVLDAQAAVGIVYCRARTFGALEGDWDLPEYSLRRMLLDNVIFCSAFFRRRDWEAAGGYDPAMTYGWEDYDFWLTLIERGVRVHRIPRVHFFYRIAAGSMVRSKARFQKKLTFLKIYRKHAPLFQEHARVWVDRIVDSRHEELEALEARRRIEEDQRTIRVLEQAVKYYEEHLDHREKHIANLERELARIRAMPVMRAGSRLRQVSDAVKAAIRVGFGSARSAAPAANGPGREGGEALRVSVSPREPRISVIVPVFNVAPKWLERTIRSVCDQTHRNWELCLVDDASAGEDLFAAISQWALRDARIRGKRLERNAGISAASNAAAAMAGGELLAFLDHDDELTPDALSEIAALASDADILYSDHEIIDHRDRRVSVNYKPDYSPDLLLSHNYITHLLVVRKTLFDAIGGFCGRCDGAQDYDLLLKAVERSERIRHIPRVLYRWRALSSSTSDDAQAKSYAQAAGLAALQGALERRGIAGQVLETPQPLIYRVRRSVAGKPRVSLLFHAGGNADFTDNALESLVHWTAYPDWELIAFSSGESGPAERMLRAWVQRDPRFTLCEAESSIGSAAAINRAAAGARGVHLVILDSRTEFFEPAWMEALLEHSQRPEVGAAGGKLYAADETVQHAGVIVGLLGCAGNSHRHVPRRFSGYAGRLNLTQNLSAVSGALLMVKKDLFQAVGGLDGETFPFHLWDIDFCLRLRQRGLLNVFTPYCEAYHYAGEPDRSDPGYRQETERFRSRWTACFEGGDPYYNPNLTLDKEDFSLKSGK